jgi:hypothetical protein
MAMRRIAAVQRAFHNHELRKASMSTMLRSLGVMACVCLFFSGTVAAASDPVILAPESELGPYVVQATLTPGGVTDEAFGNRGFTFVSDTVLVPGTGVVYVFERTPGTDVWQERAPLTPPAAVTEDVYGVDTVLVSGTGVVYIFERIPGTGVWQDSAPLTPTAPVEGFGTSFAFDGQRAIVGVRGAAVLFRRTGPDAWHQVAVLTDPDLDPDFSPSVRIDGDTATVWQSSFAGLSSSTFVFSRRDSQPESWEMSQVVTTLPDSGGSLGLTSVSALRGDTLIFHVRGIDVSAFGNRLHFFVRDAGSGQWHLVQSMSTSQGGLLTLDDSRVVVGGGELATPVGHVSILRRNVNRWVFEGGQLLSTQPFGSASISGDTMFLPVYGGGGGRNPAQILARNQGGQNAWGRLGLLRPLSGSLRGVISGDTIAISGSPQHAVVILASDIDRDGLRDGIDACPRDPQNNVAGGCARDGSAYLVLDDLISMGDVTTETVGDEFHITATFTNSSESAIGNPFFEVTELTEGNVLLNSDAGSAATGATLSPDVGDGIWSPGEPTTVTFVIGLASREPFQFYVSVKGEPSQ